jgi:uncharacterized protein (TIGR02996 family)
MNANALLAAVLASPDDDAPRLVYADWLEENGDADRANFIRAQVRLAHFDWRATQPGVERYSGERNAMMRQADELWGRHKEKWLAELPRYLQGRQVTNRVQLHRGFVEELSLSPQRLLKVSGRAWASHPIRQLTIWPEGDPHFAEVMALPHLGRIRRFSLMAAPDEAGLAALASAEGLSNVRVMSVMGDNADPTFAALARCPSLRGLVDLFLHPGFRNVTEEGLAKLFDSENVANLVALRIDDIHLPEAGARILARSARLVSLKRLSLHGHLTDEGARALSEGQHLRNLERLEVSGAKWQPTSVKKALRKRFGKVLVLDS